MNELAQVRLLLETPLATDNGVVLAQQVSDRAKWQSRISVLHREAEAKLAEAKGRLLDPTLPSEDRRKVDLAYRTRVEAQIASEYKDIADILQTHISLGQTLIKSLTQELKAQI